MFGLQLKITKNLNLIAPLRTYLFSTFSQNSTLGPGDIEIEVSKHDASLHALQQMRDKLLLIMLLS